MRDQRNSAPAEDDDSTDRTVLLILLDREELWPQSVEELARELGHDPTDSVARLRRSFKMEGWVAGS
jgi:hypothetical protein